MVAETRDLSSPGVGSADMLEYLFTRPLLGVFYERHIKGIGLQVGGKCCQEAAKGHGNWLLHP